MSGTRTERLGRISKAPSATSRRIASRTGVRLTPKRAGDEAERQLLPRREPAGRQARRAASRRPGCAGTCRRGLSAPSAGSIAELFQICDHKFRLPGAGRLKASFLLGEGSCAATPSRSNSTSGRGRRWRAASAAMCAMPPRRCRCSSNAARARGSTTSTATCISTTCWATARPSWGMRRSRWSMPSPPRWRWDRSMPRSIRARPSWPSGCAGCCRASRSCASRPRAPRRC